MALSETKRYLSLTAIGMVAATIRKDLEGVEILRQGYGESPAQQHMLLLQILNIAARGIELTAAVYDSDPEEWLTGEALHVAAR